MIPVTKSFLPPIAEYTAQVQRAYDNQWLTNRGEFVNEWKVIDKPLLTNEMRLIAIIYFYI